MDFEGNAVFQLNISYDVYGIKIFNGLRHLFFTVAKIDIYNLAYVLLANDYTSRQTFHNMHAVVAYNL